MVRIYGFAGVRPDRLFAGAIAAVPYDVVSADEVRVGNTVAQRFYRRLGYRNVFEIEGYYSDGEDALVMMKWFRF